VLEFALLGTAAALTACGSTGDLQCVPYARQRSGIALHGDAATWWERAGGAGYARGHHPSPGAVLVFRRSSGVPGGHVATVSAVASRREIRLDHANWAGATGDKGRVSQGMPAIDVSPENDWTVVRLADGTGPAGFGRPHPTYGFIYPDPAK
jgi:hypothetical protein